MKLKISGPSLAPGVTETPFPMRGPACYGKEYLQKFNEFLQGNLSTNEIIHIKNVLLTKRPIQRRKSIGKKFLTVAHVRQIVRV
jgi:hypothetical protein